MLPSRRSRSYCTYDLQLKDQEQTYMRPVPFGNTQEAWFLRPNLPNRLHGSFMPAPTDFGKESYVQKLPETKPLVTQATKILLTVRNETFYSNKFKTPIYTYKL